MGAGQSTASQLPSRGLHVLRVTPSSPASETSIEPYFDFIVGYKGDSPTPSHLVDATELEKIVESHEGRPLDLIVWNGKNKNTRVVPIVPSREWSLPHIKLPDPQHPEAERKPSLLGLAMRMCSPETSLDNVWHVLDVLEGSPAESAGLVPYGDWIIGWPGSVLGTESDFYDVVESHIEKPLRVYVYSYDFDAIREVVLVPNRHWGGEGLLGCVFGFGLLHRIPPVPEDREPGSIPAELLHPEDEYEEQQLFVPADESDDMETPEQAEERMRWEQEEWEREAYARSYMHSSDAANHIPSAYVDSAESEQDSISEKTPKLTIVSRNLRKVKMGIQTVFLTRINLLTPKMLPQKRRNRRLRTKRHLLLRDLWRLSCPDRCRLLRRRLSDPRVFARVRLGRLYLRRVLLRSASALPHQRQHVHLVP